ncbi:MAG TPA: ATP-binding protein, partial [Bacteroidia bacterium]|nr:ATP-binding protein [Bacteroidia bacterium]
NRISVGLSDNMRDLVWALHPEHATLDQLVSRLREFSGDLSEEIDIRFRRDFPASVPQQKIPKEVLRNTYLVFKEALHNAVKYSGAEEIVIAVTINRAGISIEISDNGKGFDAQAEEGKGNGLANMKHRVHSVNGKISIVSSPGKGARIAFSVPV